MAHINYKVDGRGVLNVSADTFVNGRLVRLGVQCATTQEDGQKDLGAWGQLTLDLFSEKESIQNGASVPGREI